MPPHGLTSAETLEEPHRAQWPAWASDRNLYPSQPLGFPPGKSIMSSPKQQRLHQGIPPISCPAARGAGALGISGQVQETASPISGYTQDLFQGPPAGHGSLDLHLGHLHPVWAPLQIPAAPCPTQLLANAPGEVAEDDPSCWVAATCLRDLDGVLGSCL